MRKTTPSRLRCTLTPESTPNASKDRVKTDPVTELRMVIYWSLLILRILTDNILRQLYKTCLKKIFTTVVVDFLPTIIEPTFRTFLITS